MARKTKSALLAELGSAAVGAVVGGVLGVLFAPKSGKQTRAALAKEGRKVAKKVVKKVGKK